MMTRRRFMFVAAGLSIARPTFGRSPYTAVDRAQVLGSYLGFVERDLYFLELLTDGTGYFATPRLLYHVAEWKLIGTRLELTLVGLDKGSEDYPLQASGLIVGEYVGRIFLTTTATKSNFRRELRLYREEMYERQRNDVRRRIESARNK